ncbi:hypothetical protein DXG01_008540 [Tephrocybe rancida]|nr:hypothetical protein DXG01_008540 [Tephrocybe rancida]
MSFGRPPALHTSDLSTRDVVALMQSHRRRKYQRVNSFRDALKYMLARGDRQLIEEYGVTPWQLPKNREALSALPPSRASSRRPRAGTSASDVVTTDAGSVSTTTIASAPTTTTSTTAPRKKPSCTVCLRPMKGHPRPACRTRSRAPNGASAGSPAIRPPSVTPASVPEVDDLIELTQGLNISPPAPTADIPAISDSSTPADGVRLTSLVALGTLTRSAVMMAVGTGAAFTYLSL